MRAGSGDLGMHAIHNARVQLLATALNNLALAFVVAGFVAPAVSGQLAGRSLALVTLAWRGLGIGLHSVAQAALEGIQQ
jgi:hypothetical protein